MTNTLGAGWTFGDWIARIRANGFENVISRFYSTYAANVTDAVDPQQQGRVRVVYHSLGFENQHDAYAYPISPYAGTNHGLYLPPHSDEAVWVTFDHGDLNSPRIAGGWWQNHNDNSPSTSYAPSEFVDKDGKEPTRRGLKTKHGHGYLFEDDDKSPSVQIWSGESAFQYQNRSDGTTAKVVSVGEWATKHNIMWLDDKDKQVVIATFGSAKDQQTRGSASETPRDRFERELNNRMRNEIKLSDSEGLVLVRTIGTSKNDTKQHSIIMSDTDEKIVVNSNESNHVEINDKDKFIDVRMPSVNYGLKIDQSGKKTVLNTANANTLTQNETTGTKIETTGAFDVDATKASTHKYSATQDTNVTGNMTVDIGGSWTQKVKAVASILITGALSIEGKSISIKSGSDVSITASGAVSVTASSVTVSSSSVQLGTGNIQKLVNELAVQVFNSHTHTYVAPLLPLPGPPLPTSAPIIPLVNGTHTTIATSAG